MEAITLNIFIEVTFHFHGYIFRSWDSVEGPMLPTSLRQLSFGEAVQPVHLRRYITGLPGATFVRERPLSPDYRRWRVAGLREAAVVQTCHRPPCNSCRSGKSLIQPISRDMLPAFLVQLSFGSHLYHPIIASRMWRAFLERL